MSVLNKKQHKIIINLNNNGLSSGKIAEKLNLTRQRVCQILKIYNIDSRANRREKKLNSLSIKVLTMLNDGLTPQMIRSKLNITNYQVNKLLNKNIDLRILDKEKINTRRKLITDLYKKGKTAYEIIDILNPIYPSVKVPNDIYKDVDYSRISVNRANTRVKGGKELRKIIKKVGSKHTLYETLNIVKNKGYKNLNGGDLKFHSVVRFYYDN
jgi:hypothetical protein